MSQAQLASRHYPSEESRDYEIQDQFNPKNVLTLLRKGTKAAGLDRSLVDDLYSQLSDAAHPSYGSLSAYETQHRIDPSEAQIWWKIGRGPKAVPDPRVESATKPDVAIATARALSLSLEQFAINSPSHGQPS